MLPKPAGERPHGGGMRVGFIRPWSRCPRSGKRTMGRSHFVAPCVLVDELELELARSRSVGTHAAALLPASERGMYSAAEGWCHGL